MAKPSPSRLADAYQTYPTASAAAVASLRGIKEKNGERGGGILYNKEQNVYAATDPVGQNDGSHFAAAVSVPQGWQLHSTYHTHPSGQRSTVFSGDDIDTAQQLKAPSYVLARDDNKIRTFDPASSKVSKDSSWKFSDNRYSNGSLIDETPPKSTPEPAPSAVATAAPSPAPAATVPVAGSRVTMKDFVNHHRAQTTKYRHKIVHIKSGAPKRP
jgi:proteasome lid subunit RPN8/RPN11